MVALIDSLNHKSIGASIAIATGDTKFFQTDKMIMIILLKGQLGQPPLRRRTRDTQGAFRPF